MFSGLSAFFRPLMRLGLVSQIAIGIVAGVLLVIVSPEAARSVAVLGQLFVLALKAVAPVLVFVLVAAAIARHKQGQPTHIRANDPDEGSTVKNIKQVVYRAHAMDKLEMLARMLQANGTKNKRS